MIRSGRSPVRGDTRIALVGAQASEGVRIKKVLEAMQVDGSRVDLFGSCDGEQSLSDYNGEARVIQEADRAAIERHGLIFLCEPDSFTERYLADPEKDTVALDLTGTGYRRGGLDLAHDRFRPPAPAAAGGLWCVPDSLSLLLAEILQPLVEDAGLEEVTAFVLRPAADFGDSAVEELRKQTVQLLNFGSPPTECFHRQLAFNAVPDRYVPAGGGEDRHRRIVRETAVLTRIDPGRLYLEMAVLPMFYGHGAMIRIRTDRDAAVDRLYEILDAQEGIQASSGDGGCTPMEVNGRGGTSVSLIRRAGNHRREFWLWAAADDADTRAAVQAIRLARRFGVL